MGVLHRRYICVFSLVFLLTSLFALSLPTALKISVAIGSAVVAPLSLISAIFLNRISIVKENRRDRCRLILLCTMFLTLSLLLANLGSLFAVNIPLEKAQRCEGVHRVMLEVKDTDTKDKQRFNAKIVEVEGKRVDLAAEVICDLPRDVSYGDKIVATAELSTNNEYPLQSTSLVGVVILQSEEAFFQPRDAEPQENIGFARRVEYALQDFREAFKRHVDSIFGEDIGAVVKGVLINDASDISANTKAEFRRAGASHLLAVSGLHISVLLGALELLLRKIGIPRRARCVLIAFFAIALLILTNFSPSAVRSVFMLFSVYYVYLTGRDVDPVTVLFMAISLIVIVSPVSIVDVGMWMSFLATLGILTVGVYLFDKIPYKKTKNKLYKRVQLLGIGILQSIIITLIANLALLPISWYFFGSVSLVSIATNLLLSPLMTLFLPLAALCLMLGTIPYVGQAIVLVTGELCRLILGIIEFFSGVRGGVLSLRYHFMPALMIAFIVVMVILLAVKLKRKWICCIPPVLLVLAMIISVLVFELNSLPKMKYVGYNSSEYLMFYKGSNVTVCDMSNGSQSSTRQLLLALPRHSVEIENYVITRCGTAHADSIERILQKSLIRRIYLPTKVVGGEGEGIERIFRIARENNIDIIPYDEEKSICTLGDSELKIYTDIIAVSAEKLEKSVCLDVSAAGESRFLYIDRAEPTEKRAPLIEAEQYEYIMLGTAGVRQEQARDSIAVEGEVIAPSHQRYGESIVRTDIQKVRIITRKKFIKTYTLPLG